VEVIGLPVILPALKEGIFPVPLEAIPIAVFELVQVKIAPVGLPEKTVAAMVPPHTSISEIKFIVDTGGTITVIPLLIAVPGQVELETTLQLKIDPSAIVVGV